MSSTILFNSQQDQDNSLLFTPEIKTNIPKLKVQYKYEKVWAEVSDRIVLCHRNVFDTAQNT